MHISFIETSPDPWGLGIRLLSSIVKKAGHSTRLIMLATESEMYSSRVLAEAGDLLRDSDLICVSCLSRGASRASQVLKSIHSLKKLSVWGGIHATLNPDKCAELADLVCRGEGEGFILELVERLDAGRGWEDIKNAAYLRNDTVVKNEVRPFVADLDSLPMFDFDRSDEFHLRNGNLEKISPSVDITNQGEMFYIGSRGCDFHCTYCCNVRLKELYTGKGKYVRKMSIQRYVDELEVLSKTHFPEGKYFFLLDEDFFARDTRDLREFAEIYPQRVGVPFECCGSPARITEEKIQLLADAGLWRIRMGVESGSERTKRVVYKRPMTNELIKKAALIVEKRSDVIPCYFFIIGNPYEMREDLLDTFRLLAEIPPPFYAQMFNLVFFPGSELYDRALKDRIISGMDDSGFELNFRGGLQFEHHEWKWKNLYLNALLFMVEGKITRLRLGLLPRFILGFLLHSRVVAFCERHHGISNTLVRAKVTALSVRHTIGIYLKTRIEDPRGIYKGKLWISERLTKMMSRIRV